MIVAIDDKLISTELFERKFVCDLNACKGACCVEGDQGAPLTMAEAHLMERILDDVKPYMREEGIAAVDTLGVYYMDPWNEPAATLVNGKECAFVYFDETSTAKCAIEKAYYEGKVTWKKPISCHLYPIRVKQIGEDLALNYDEWHICKPACECGSQLDVPVYKFLKEPLVRAFGQDFYDDLEGIDKTLRESDFGDEE